MAKPLLYWEDAIGTSSTRILTRENSGGAPDQTQIDILMPTHPIIVNAGLAAGACNIFDQPATSPPAAAPMGRAGYHRPVGRRVRTALFVYEKGSKLLSDFDAPDRRMEFCWWDDGFGKANADGVALFDAAVDYMIPEPATMSLLCLGALGLLRRQTLRRVEAVRSGCSWKCPTRTTFSEA